VENKLAQYKQKWLNHVSRMKDIRYPKHLGYRPIRKRTKTYMTVNDTSRWLKL